MLYRFPSDNNAVINDIDVALLALNLDLIGALVGGPGQIDVANAGVQIERKGRRIFEWPLMEAARFERRRNAAGNTGPAHDAIERMPAVIEQDAAACNCRIKAPIFPPVRGESDRRLGAQGSPTNRPNGADRSFGDQRRDLEADWRFEPIVNRVHSTPGARRGRCQDLRVFHARNQRLLTENVKARVQRSLNELCMAARRRADVYKIERFARQQVIHAFVPAPFGTRPEKDLAARRNGIGCSDNSDIGAGLPAGQVPVSRDVSKADKCAPQHVPPSQSSPNWRAIAAND